MAVLEHYIQVGKKRLRCGYTTGTCAAAAARGAAELLLGGALPGRLVIDTPAGIAAELEPVDSSRGEDWARCAVQKDAGDDPDVTGGALVYARVERIEGDGIVIDGGRGVGRITKPGLDQPVGEAAINSAPRRMIAEQMLEVKKAHGLSGGLKVTVSIPDGERLAAKTFNPRLGIEGGISVLGTSGIVRPMSTGAIIDTMRLEMDMLRAAGCRDLLAAPGNYGDRFSRGELALSTNALVLCSNYVGDCIDYAAALGFSSMLLVGHMGKLIKTACGNMNTHSGVSDGRREALTAHAALCGASRALLSGIYSCGTTDEAVAMLDGEGLRQPVMRSIAAALEENLKRRGGDKLRIEAVFFSNQFGVLGKTSGADELLQLHRRGKED